MMDSDQPPSTSTPTSTSAITSAVDVSAHRSCQRCSRRMSSYKSDKHTLCLHCRDVICSVEVRCSECSSWYADLMHEYLKHRKSLVSKGKKKPVVTTPSSSPSVPPSVSPSVSSLVANPSLPSVSDDQKIKAYVHSILSSFLSQSGSVGINPSFSAPMEEPNPTSPLRGATGGGGGGETANLSRGRHIEPSGMVPSSQEDVDSPFQCLCMMCIIVGLA